jgi:hypothetical protein
MTRLIVFVSLLGAVASTCFSPSRADAAALYEELALTPPNGNAANFFRINISTGDTIITFNSQYSKIVDPTPIPVGDYHLYIAETPDTKNYSLERMDRLTGRIWTFGSGKWAEIVISK